MNSSPRLSRLRISPLLTKVFCAKDPFQARLGLIYLLLSILLWVVTTLSRLKFNGFVYGFDYSIYQPDGSNYTFRTLSWLYNDNTRASMEVADWYLVHGIKHNIIDPSTLLPENSPVWYLSAPRVLYPLLSLPFVMLLGIPGMLVVPCLSFLGLMTIIHLLSRQGGIVWVGFLINLMLCSSSTVTRWFVANITDGLLTFLVALFVLLEARHQILRNWVLAAFPIIFLSSLTRFCLPIFFFLGLGYFLQNNRRKATLTWLFSLGGFIPFFLLTPKSNLLQVKDGDSFPEQALTFVIQSFKVLAIEFIELLVLDKILLALIILALYSSIKIKNEIGVLAICSLIGVFAIGFINGTLGVNFRYQMPFLPFAAWAIISYSRTLRIHAVR